MIKSGKIIAKKDIFRALAEKYDLSVILLYGSVASGKTISESDVDFAVLSDKVIDFGILFKIEEEIKEVLKFSKVQVVDMKSASENFLAEILPDGLPVFLKNPTAFEAFKIYIWKVNAESKWLRDMNYAFLKKNIMGMA